MPTNNKNSDGCKYNQFALRFILIVSLFKYNVSDTSHQDARCAQQRLPANPFFGAAETGPSPAHVARLFACSARVYMTLQQHVDTVSVHYSYRTPLPAVGFSTAPLNSFAIKIMVVTLPSASTAAGVLRDKCD